MTEEWKPIDWCPLYSVSSLGRVRYEGRHQVVDDVMGRRYTRYHKPGVRKVTVTAGHYARVTLYDGETRHHEEVHRLVAAAFLGPCPSGQEVRHLDGDKYNNAASNLAYGTRAENIGDKIAPGTVPMGELVACANLTEAEGAQIRKRRAAGETGNSLAKEFGVGPAQISRIVRGLRWAHVAGYATLAADRVQERE